jgi:CHAT domain-containing protein/tetratricopeptide (TPR) repeat protein
MRVALFSSLLIFLLLPRWTAAATLAECEARFRAAPQARESAECFSDLAANQGLYIEAAQRIRKLLASDPHNPWLLFNLGRVLWATPSQAEGTFRAAAEEFAAHRDAEGEILARVSLHVILTALGRPNEAEAEVNRVRDIALRSGDPLLIARSQVLEARHLRLRGENLERAFLLLHRAQDEAFPDGPFGLQRDCLEELAVVSHSLGRLDEERSAYRQLIAMAQAHGERRTEAVARYGSLRTQVEELIEMPRPEGRAEATERAREVLAAASAVGYRDLIGRAHLILGRLTQGAEAKAHIDQCLADLTAPADRALCLTALAELSRERDPATAERAVEEALALTIEAKEPWSRIEAWRERMRVSWASLPRERALADSRSTLNVVEAIRDRQRSELSRAGVASVWSEDYYWLSGRLLEAGDAAGLEEAFGVMERLRARTLLEGLNAARAAAPGPPTPLQERRTGVLEEIAGVQRKLLDPALPPADRPAALKELHRLEIEEADLRDKIAAVDLTFDNPRPMSFAVLPQVRQALAPDEALLSFQVAPDKALYTDFGGGSWLLVSTQAGTRAIRLRRDRVALRPAVEVFDGLFERRDGSEARPAAGLYRDLLDEALRGLPATVRRLIIVPDDALHQFPFAALRRDPNDPPLAASYEITLAPSATLWLHWRASRPAAARQPLLALADPELFGEKTDQPPLKAAERAAIFADGLTLGALPFARQEGTSAVDHLGDGSVLRVGKEASEGFLKTTDLRRFGILHFATHAILDDQHPERSGVLLTPAPATEDGLLQLREIVALPLEGRVVVLSSCRSASGQMLKGEGVMGLARAFFQGGAHTVVASLWPLRDDDGAALFDRFYAHLAEGRSIAEALHAAQRDRIAEGAPAYAWAGLAVLGDGDLVPLPGGRKRPGWVLWAAVAGGMVLLAGLGALAWRRVRG